MDSCLKGKEDAIYRVKTSAGLGRKLRWLQGAVGAAERHWICGISSCSDLPTSVEPVLRADSEGNGLCLWPCYVQPALCHPHAILHHTWSGGGAGPRGHCREVGDTPQKPHGVKKDMPRGSQSWLVPRLSGGSCSGDLLAGGTDLGSSRASSQGSGAHPAQDLDLGAPCLSLLAMGCICHSHGRPPAPRCCWRQGGRLGGGSSRGPQAPAWGSGEASVPALRREAVILPAQGAGTACRSAVGVVRALGKAAGSWGQGLLGAGT